jgi:hypothetical protein
MAPPDSFRKENCMVSISSLFSRLARLRNVPVQVSRKGAFRRGTAARSALENLEGRMLCSFSLPVSYAAGSAPVAMISGDFNGDGHADVLSSNSFPAAVTTLLGNGDGTFQAPLSSPLSGTPGSPYTGSQAGTLAIGDYNADGRLDVSVVSGTSVITVLGNGDGTFQAPQTTVLGSSPARLSTGDVNGDGRADILAANITGTVSVLLSNGDGTFAPKVEYAAGPSAQDVKAVDLNHDGKLDLVVANALSAGTVSTLMGNGDGTFQAYHSYYSFSAPYRMNVADYNGDGNMDVGVANSYTSSCVTILLGNYDGTFQPYHSYDTGFQPWELESKDVNGDGLADLIDSNGSSYQVETNNGDGTFGVPTTYTGAGWVFAADDFNGDGTADIAGATGANIGVLINNTSAITHISTATSFAVSAAATTVAGAPLSLTVSAVDSAGNVVADFTGTVHISSTDPRMPGLNYTFISGDAGSHTFSTGVSLFTAGVQTINVKGPSALTGSADVAVTAAAASRFSLTADASGQAGAAVNFTVSATDLYGNLATDYVGSVHFSSSDAQAVLPADAVFSATDAGRRTFTAVLKTAGNQTISAADTLVAAAAGTSNAIAIAAGDAVSLSLIGGGGHIGSPHTVTVTARDAFGNVATGYNGTVHLSASDARMVLPADGTLAGGVGTFTVTPMTLGTQTLSASDVATGALVGTETITGTPGVAATFVMSPVAGGVAGTTRTVTITAYDAFGNVAVDYAGTLVLSSSDFQATLPSYTFTAADLGTHTMSIVLRTAGAQSLTARDLYTPALSATQTGISVTAAAAATMSTTLLTSSVAGVAQSFTVTARDAFGNIASGFRDTVAFATSDTLAALPAAYTFAAADAGTHTFSVIFKSASGQTFTVTDTTNPLMSTFQRDIQITPAAMSGFSFRAPSNVSAGVAFNVTLSAVDIFGNVIPTYTGKVHFTGASGGGNILPPDYTFTAADAGSHVFSVTFASTGTQTLGVQDVLNGSLKGSTSVTVKTSTNTGGGGGGGGGTATGGGGTSTGGGGGGGGGGGKKVV